MQSLETLLRVGGLLHFGILLASAMVPQVLDWRAELSRVSPFTRRLVWVHGAFIVLTIVGFGVLSLAHAESLASGAPLARSCCVFVALFWSARLGVQAFVFDAGPVLTTALLKFGYHGLTAVFAYFAIIYGWAALATH